MFTKQKTNNKLFLRSALNHSLTNIKKSLKVKVVGIERVTKIYRSKSNSFLIKTISNNKDRIVTYFLKFDEDENIKKEIKGTRFVERFLPTPKIILTSKNKMSEFGWLLFEYIPGKLMAEKFLQIKNKKDLELFCELEKQKEKLLNNLHFKSKVEINYDNYIKSRTNRLFYDRLFGKRYKLFFAKSPDNISSYFNRQFVINNKEFPYTVNQVFESIRKKYSLHNNRKITAIKGQGDAHHGNIIVDKKIWFIDNEYADFMPPFMELAKPYYNDFIGTLFFHHHKTLNQYFKVSSFEDTGTQLVFKIKCPQKITNFLKITKIKLQKRKKLINNKTKDFLSLNDYLILCHILTKDPNKYPLKTKLLFLVFIAVLSQFDPLNPESIYDYF
ncbi:MAG: hypothetical protein NTV77_02900 [Candidatus Azambacteria bacterium]|nr:hypothetical protein [Candidatus Azambacteria bacterium]